MGFNAERFNTTNFRDRVEHVKVPRLAAFFDLKDEETPAWEVKGLTGEQSAIAKQAVQENQNIEAILNAVGSKVGKNIEDGIKELAGIHSTADEKVPDELIQRFAWLKLGSVNPECDHQMAVRLAKNFPEDFYLLTNKIMQLTGQGRLGELPGSGGSPS